MKKSCIISRNQLTPFFYRSATTTSLGRGIRKVVTLFADIRAIVREADQYQTYLDGEPEPEDTTAAVKRRYVVDSKWKRA